MSIQLEICANSVSSAVHAQQGGADRVELCTALELGGLTPSPASIIQCRQRLQIAMFVLIRPRPGDFCYSPAKIDLMEKEIEFCKGQGIDGVVLGILTNEGKVDRTACQRLIDRARPMEVTFHRAFDRVLDPFSALNELLDLRIDRLLSSGRQKQAVAGTALLGELVRRSNNSIAIMAGAGINSGNVESIIQKTGVGAVHCSAKQLKNKTKVVESQVTFNPAGTSEGAYYETSLEEVQAIRAVLDRLAITH